MAVGWSALDDREPFLQRAQGLRDAHLFNELWPQAVLAEDKLTGLVGSKRIGLAGDKLPDTTKQAQLNRLILEALYGGEYFLERTSPEPALCWSQDQWARLIWMLGGLAAFACGCFIDMNTTSLHGFYKQKLQDAYVVRDTEGKRLKDLKTTAFGGPYHFLCTTLNSLRRLALEADRVHLGIHVLLQPVVLRVASCFATNLSRAARPAPADQKGQMRGYLRTEDYCDGRVTVAAAAAISGAAFSPAITRSPLLFFMTMLLNVRLGQWVPNPRQGKSEDTGHARWGGALPSVSALTVLWDFLQTRLGRRKPNAWKYCFLTDGGHNDNLGVSPLIFRRCRLMVVSDSTRDPHYQFEDFLKAYRRYRIRGGMNFRPLEDLSDLTHKDDDRTSLDLAPLRPRSVNELESDTLASVEKKEGRRGWLGKLRRRQKRQIGEKKARRLPDQSERHFLITRLTYPNANDRPTIIVYLKSTMTGDEPANSASGRSTTPSSPTTLPPTNPSPKTRWNPDRQLGQHIGLEMCNAILNGRKRLAPLECNREGDLWKDNYGADELVEFLLFGYLDARLPEDSDDLIRLVEEIREYPYIWAHVTNALWQRELDACQLHRAMSAAFRRLRHADGAREWTVLTSGIKEMSKAVRATLDKAAQSRTQKGWVDEISRLVERDGEPLSQAPPHDAKTIISCMKGVQEALQNYRKCVTEQRATQGGEEAPPATTAPTSGRL